MSRRFALVALALTFFVAGTPTTGQAQGRRSGRSVHHGHRHAPPYSYRHRGYSSPRWSSSSTFFGLSFGTYPYGYDYAGYPDPYFLYPYSYDPWMRGSFRAPDLLDDPYFYDRVPNVNRYHAPPVLQTQPRQPLVRSYRPPQPQVPAQGSGEVRTSESTAEVIEALQTASETLLLALARYGGGEAWIEHLRPDHIIALALEGKTSELNQLLTRYDQVVQNRELQVVSTIDGFAETRNHLRQYLRQPITSPAGTTDESAIETLPAPAPEAAPEPRLPNASEI